MGKTPKILTNDKYKYYELELPIYKTKNGCSLVKIGNIFYNIDCHNTINKIKEEYNKYIRIELYQEDNDYVII
jgi:hypothetical protein